jgi:DNA invertase Pin-like site-specific DNA recombinase
MNTKAALFVRVSSTNDRQDYNRQIDDLRKYCEISGFEVSCIIAEKISGAKKTDERIGLLELMEKAKKGEFDIVAVSELSRLGRNAFEIQKLIEEFSALKISIHIESLNIQTLDNKGQRSAMSNLMIAILSQFAQIERETLITRVKSGLQRARILGKKLGRPKGATDDRDILLKYKPVVQDIKNNISIRKIAKIHNISQNTILKVKRAMANAA